MTAGKKEDKITAGSLLVTCTNLSVKRNLNHGPTLKQASLKTTENYHTQLGKQLHFTH